MINPFDILDARLTNMNNSFERGLSDAEFIELGELLASLPENCDPMESDYLDGYLTALLCLPEEPSPVVWMPLIFDSHSSSQAHLDREDLQDRLEELIYRRYKQIDKILASGQKLDPIVFEIEDDKGRPVKGYDSIAAVIPFCLGFVQVIDTWPGLKDTGNELINSALLGILRHLPDEIAGDLLNIKEELALESPLENLDQALDDIAESVAEIVEVTRGLRRTTTSITKKQKRSTKHNKATSHSH